METTESDRRYTGFLLNVYENGWESGVVSAQDGTGPARCPYHGNGYATEAKVWERGEQEGFDHEYHRIKMMSMLEELCPPSKK